MNQLELRAHEAGQDHPATWDALEMVYCDRPALLAELTILENCGAADLVRFLSADNATRGRVIAGVMGRGGLHDACRKFAETKYSCS